MNTYSHRDKNFTCRKVRCNNRIITVIRPASTRGDDVDARDGRPRARRRARVALGASRALGVVRTRGGARVHQSDLRL